MCIKVYMLILVLSKFIQTEVTMLNRMYTLCHCAMKSFRNELTMQTESLVRL